VDLLTGAAHGDELTLPPFGALVLKELSHVQNDRNRGTA
jgi:hypothetical protein